MTRQKQRKIVFQLTYALNYQGLENKATILEEFYNQQENPQPFPYIDNSIEGICVHWEELNSLIQPALKNWSIGRLDAVCLAILRVATYELKFNPEIPDRVAVNEAIEIAKEFGDEDSASFIHGVLSAIAK